MVKIATSPANNSSAFLSYKSGEKLTNNETPNMSVMFDPEDIEGKESQVEFYVFGEDIVTKSVPQQDHNVFFMILLEHFKGSDSEKLETALENMIEDEEQANQSGPNLKVSHVDGHNPDFLPIVIKR